MHLLRNLLLLYNFACLVTFEQHDYKVILERYSLDWYNTDYFANISIKYFYYTRTQKRFNASFNLLQDLGHNIRVHVQVFKFQSNEYREFPVVFNENQCDIAKQDTFGTSVAHFDTNMKDCPIKKGYYYIRNAYLNDTKLPPLAPRGRYMLNMTYTYQKHVVLAYAKIYGEIKPTNPLERVVIG